MIVTTRNAAFQRWQALLTNRGKRTHAGRFLVQGVRPISLAVEHGWHVDALLYPHGRRLSRWACDLLDAAPGVAVAPDLLAELGEKEAPELVAVVAMPPDDLARIPADSLAVVLDRPASPGNVGTIVRSADAFGAAGVIVTGHAADPYDPRALRASTGSLFAIPVVRAASHRAVLDRFTGVRVVGSDESAGTDIAACDLTVPTLLVVGNETTGLSAGWREACEETVAIPIGGAASSLNVASAASIMLYEAARQRAERAEAVPSKSCGQR